MTDFIRLREIENTYGDSNEDIQWLVAEIKSLNERLDLCNIELNGQIKDGLNE